MKVISVCNAQKPVNETKMDDYTDATRVQGEAMKKELCASAETVNDPYRTIESSKKRKKVISWPSVTAVLRKSSASSQSDPDLKAQLFGQPLSIIFEDDTLPKPIFDILMMLFLKGLYTEGIFRRAANEKARKGLKQELNSGVNVPLEDKSVHLLAAVFKDFLRCIPQYVLHSELYDKWMAAMEKEDTNERIEELKKVLDKLPKPNLILLQHLFCVLHHIHEKAHINRMDASNLAICIAPNMLNQDKILPLEAQKDINAKVTPLVTFLIKNCCKIFGDEILQLLGTPSESAAELSVSGLSLCQENDSACDITYQDGDCDPDELCIKTKISSSSEDELSSQLLLCHRGKEPIRSLLSSEQYLSRMERRCSEPNILPSQEISVSKMSSQKLARSHDNFPVEQENSLFQVQGLKKHRLAKHLREKLPDKKVMKETEGAALQLDVSPTGSSKASSTCSLDSSRSNSDSSVFTSSPPPSPSAPKKSPATRHQSFIVNELHNKSIKKTSMSFCYAKKPLGQTRSWGPGKSLSFRKDNIKTSSKQEKQSSCDIVQEDSASWTEQVKPTVRPRLLSADEVFQMVDSKIPGKPPSYAEATQNEQALPVFPKNMTVEAMRQTLKSSPAALPSFLHKELPNSIILRNDTLPRKDRPSSLTDCFISSRTQVQDVDYLFSRTSVKFDHQKEITPDNVIQKPIDASLYMVASAFRPRTMSESTVKQRDKRPQQCCSQQLLEFCKQIPHAKESYV
ncbi:T-cell activation Rho GTPase-activating protein [Protopterus annectens]|uniref:T-cell activation Rho GTPase-activating protein n=1 Tax=Protopterus annectens TaxID=7888 RepID=UPI001CFB3AAA|nr:T-cell activation Rho GTPase-activating protein [Protopterus annectens]XP_043910637.1 T-cell activation Rho GTPase-activating protein [Protopterus annectens]